MGAILAVLGPGPGLPSHAAGQRVLKLSAAKSSLGHAEPAAGAFGMLHSMHRWGREDRARQCNDGARQV